MIFNLFLIVVIAAVILWCLFVLFYLGALIVIARAHGKATVTVKPFAPKGLKYEVRKGLVTA